MNRILLASLFIAAIGLSFWGYKNESSAPVQNKIAVSDKSLIMYSLKGCPRCLYMRRELGTKSYAYQELMIDHDIPLIDLVKRMKEAGVALGDTIGFPVMEVKGKFLIAPTINEIESALAGS